ncbi:MAG TPA: F0F1 ATP synthase subunit epsilon, partial [Peptococcaceae bacterium]|nr:F0F1 ATP synthase subunit epsilon [Peptococcaceae bacterium]
MAENLTLEVVTPERILLKEESYSIIVPATEGLMGLWPNHAPIITGLNPGIIKYRQNDNMRVLAIGGG